MRGLRGYASETFSLLMLPTAAPVTCEKKRGGERMKEGVCVKGCESGYAIEGMLEDARKSI